MPAPLRKFIIYTSRPLYLALIRVRRVFSAGQCTWLAPKWSVLCIGDQIAWVTCSRTEKASRRKMVCESQFGPTSSKCVSAEPVCKRPAESQSLTLKTRIELRGRPVHFTGIQLNALIGVCLVDWKMGRIYFSRDLIQRLKKIQKLNYFYKKITQLTKN